MLKPIHKSQIMQNFPFKQKGINNLLFLEDLSTKKNAKNKFIKELIENYAQLIEFYDAMKDPIRFYFIDKIQALILNFNLKKNLESIENFKNKKNENFDSFKNLIICEDFKNSDTDEEKLKKNYSEDLKIPMKLFNDENISGENIFKIRKEFRQKKMMNNNKIGNDMRKSHDFLNKKIENFETNFKKNSEIIKNGLDFQEIRMSQQLNLRRERSKSKSRSTSIIIKKKKINVSEKNLKIKNFLVKVKEKMKNPFLGKNKKKKNDTQRKKG